MRKIFLLLICLLIFPCVALAWMNLTVISGSSAGGTCTVLDIQDTTNGSLATGSENDRYYGGTTLATSYTDVCKIEIDLVAVGTVTGQTWYLREYTKSGTALDSLVQTVVTKAGDSAWNGYVDFIPASPVNLTSGNALVLTRDAVSGSAYIAIRKNTAGGQANWTNATLWDNAKAEFFAGSPHDLRMKIHTVQ